MKCYLLLQRQAYLLHSDRLLAVCYLVLKYEISFSIQRHSLLKIVQQLSYYFPDKTMWQSFVCAMTAAVTLHALDPFRTGKLVLYQVVYTTGWHGFEMIPFSILGIFGVSFSEFAIFLLRF